MPRPWRANEAVTVRMSPCEQFRYSLEVSWGHGTGWLVVVGLNPSKADATRDDNTVRKCINFGMRNGYAGLLMLNCYAFRATKPRDMMAAVDPFGEQTPAALTALCNIGTVVAAWGGGAKHLDRGEDMAREFKRAGIPLWCWGINKDGTPAHPCYLSLGPLRRWE